MLLGTGATFTKERAVEAFPDLIRFSTFSQIPASSGLAASPARSQQLDECGHLRDDPQKVSLPRRDFVGADMGSRDTTNLKLLDELPDHPDGVKKWRIRFAYTDPTWKGGGHSRVCQRHYDGTLAQAQAERDHLKLYLRQGEDPEDYPRAHEEEAKKKIREAKKKVEDGITFNALKDLYFKQRQTEGLAASTLSGERLDLENYILPAIGKWIIEAVRLRDFQDLRMKWHREYVETDEKSSATVNKWIRELKHFVGWCARRRGIAHPCRDLKRLPKPSKKRGRAMSREELQKLLASIPLSRPLLYGGIYGPTSLNPCLPSMGSCGRRKRGNPV